MKLDHLHESDFERRKRERDARLHPSQTTDSLAQQGKVRESNPKNFLKEIFKVNNLVAQALQNAHILFSTPGYQPPEIYRPVLPDGQELAINLQSAIYAIYQAKDWADSCFLYRDADKIWRKWGQFVQEFAKNYGFTHSMYNLERYPHAVSLSALKQGQEPHRPLLILGNQCPF